MSKVESIVESVSSLNVSVNAVINVLLIVILAVCAWQGYKKGIIMGIIEVLVIILSLYGAQLLSDTYSYEVIPVLKPFVSGYMEAQVETNTYEAFGYTADETTGNYNVPYSMTDMLNADPSKGEEIAFNTYKELGLYDDMAQNLTDKTMAYVRDNGASLSSAVVTTTCQSITWYGGFLLAFIIIFAILMVIVNIPNLSFKLPYVGIVNDIGGIVIGLFVGALFCSVIVWVFKFAGLLLPEETLRATGLADFFLTKDLLGNYISL